MSLLMERAQSHDASHRKCLCKELGGQGRFRGAKIGHRTQKAAGGAQQAQPSQQGSKGRLLCNAFP